MLLGSTSGVQSKARDSDGHTFRIVVQHSIGNCKAKSPGWDIAETDIKMVEALQPVPAASSNTAAINATLSHATGQSRVALQSRSVRFQSPPRIRPASTPPPASPPLENVLEIQDLCESMDNLITAPCDGGCLGYMIGDQNRHGLFTPKHRLIDQKLFSVGTLTEFLDNQRKRKLTGADARRLALPLATGMLQLHSTPWLQSTWGKSDIMLISKEGKVLSQYPFISQESLSASKTVSASPPKGTLALLIKNQTLFSLGVMLIELCMDKSMVDLHEAGELNPDGTRSEFSVFQTAQRLLEMEVISDRFGKRWSDVVRRCIFCELDETKRSLEDAGFRKAVYNKILLELEEDHRQFFGL